jgi:site-specific recombinase XerD
MTNQHELRLEAGTEVSWTLSGPGADKYPLVNQYLGYLADRNYSPRTLRAYGYDLLAFCRWLDSVNIDLGSVTTETVLDFMRYCRQTPIAGRPANVLSMTGKRLDHYSSTTINHRLAALTGLFTFRALREPDLRNPIPSGREARRVSAEERNGLLGHLVRPKRRSALRLREPRRLPRALNRRETADLLSSLRTWRDRSLAGLMLLSGLRSGELLTLDVTDVDIGARWVRVMGKGAKERRVPLDVEVAGLIQTYLLTERPESTSTRLFLVAKGPNRGQPLTAAGFRTIFRYHRLKSGVPAGHPHALRHTFGTAMAEAGVDLAVMQALLGHTHVDTTARYIHLAPTHVKAEFDAARTRLRART